jgi:hypothetical protein
VGENPARRITRKMPCHRKEGILYKYIKQIYYTNVFPLYCKK